ncbi:MAG: sugar ABC transporter permease [Solirubrobacterales bacterium]|nr:sugar ABC transporter permease [Solirubrobacterales bacterium]
MDLSRALPYLLLAPALLTVLAIFAYPLLDGLRASTQVYRFGEAIDSVGLKNYTDVLGDPEFRTALWTTLKFVTLSVALETVLGLALALFCARTLPFIRLLRSILIIPMVVTPVAIGIVFRLLYSSDVGLFTTVSEGLGGGAVQILSKESGAFLGLVALDVWEWTPLIFLICLAGIQSLPTEPFEAAKVDGASTWRTFWDHTLPMLRPVLTVAIVLRTIEAFTTFDQPFVLTRGGPGTSTKLISQLGYETAFKFQQVGYAMAMLVMVGLVVLAVSFVAVRLIRRTADEGVAA